MCKCYENFIQELETENTVNGVKPIIASVPRIITVSYKKYSMRNKAHSKHFSHTGIKINYCPICGEKLSNS